MAAERQSLTVELRHNSSTRISGICRKVRGKSTLRQLSFSCGARFGVGPKAKRHLHFAWTDVNYNFHLFFSAKSVVRRLAQQIGIAQAEQVIFTVQNSEARFPHQETCRCCVPKKFQGLRTACPSLQCPARALDISGTFFCTLYLTSWAPPALIVFLA